MISNSVISFIIVLGVLIFVHELGHFITAKLFGVKVLKFSLGFGPKIISKTHGDTEYLLSAIPLGGYVKMHGEVPSEQSESHDTQGSFSDKPVWQRFLVVLAGPVFNLLFAVFVFFMIYSINGMPHSIPGTEIGQVTPDSPAARAGLQPGDIIREINGITTDDWQLVSTTISQSNGNDTILLIERDDELISLTGKPEKSEVKNLFGEVVEHRFILGISKKDEVVYQKTSILNALIAGLQQTWAFIYLTIMSIVKIFQRIVPASELGGPIMIANLAGQQLEAGWINLWSFTGVLSINLGIINLFPIPILDGGHLVFFSIEALRNKPISLKVQGVMQQIGIVLLGTLMIFVLYNDFARLFTN